MRNFNFSPVDLGPPGFFVSSRNGVRVGRVAGLLGPAVDSEFVGGRAGWWNMHQIPEKTQREAEEGFFCCKMIQYDQFERTKFL